MYEFSEMYFSKMYEFLFKLFILGHKRGDFQKQICDNLLKVISFI